MNELIKTSTGELLPFISASLSSDVSSWVWSVNFALPDLATLNKLKPTRALKGDYVESSFKLGLETFNLIIEEADSNDTDFSYAVTGRSKSILLAEPYSTQITKTWRLTSAMAICAELCTEAGIALYWQAIDWDIDEFISDKRYPIDIISELAGEVEAPIATPSATPIAMPAPRFPIAVPMAKPSAMPIARPAPVFLALPRSFSVDAGSLFILISLGENLRERSSQTAAINRN